MEKIIYIYYKMVGYSMQKLHFVNMEKNNSNKPTIWCIIMAAHLSGL